MLVHAFALLCLGACSLLNPGYFSESSRTLEAYKDAHYRELGTEISTTLDWPQFLSEARQTRVLFFNQNTLSISSGSLSASGSLSDGAAGRFLTISRAATR